MLEQFIQSLENKISMTQSQIALEVQNWNINAVDSLNNDLQKFQEELNWLKDLQSKLG